MTKRKILVFVENETPVIQTRSQLLFLQEFKLHHIAFPLLVLRLRNTFQAQFYIYKQKELIVAYNELF
jgi:hypothetical protein